LIELEVQGTMTGPIYEDDPSHMHCGSSEGYT